MTQVMPFLYKNRNMRNLLLNVKKIGVKWGCFEIYFKLYINLRGCY